MEEVPESIKITAKLVAEIIKKRNPNAHKGTCGHAIIVAGSYGKIGAAVLAAKACLKTGVGLLTMYIPKCGYNIMQTSLPEAMVICDENETMIATELSVEKYNVVGMGCGIGTNVATEKVVKKIIQSVEKPMIIDADAINIISENKTWLKWIPIGSIFTPHTLEFERLCGKSANEEERKMKQIDFSKTYNVYVVLKGHQTVISCPDEKFFTNTTGNAGMAKAGNGDALTGMLTALLAQGYTAEQACIAGVYLHGLAGDMAVKETGEFSLLASDLIDSIGQAFLNIMQVKKK